MRLVTVVGIPTVGRASIPWEVLQDLACRSPCPDQGIICAQQPSDVVGIYAHIVKSILSPVSLPAQRNAILDAPPDAELVLFFDDDFLPQPDYPAKVEQAFLPRRLVPERILNQ